MKELNLIIKERMDRLDLEILEAVQHQKNGYNIDFWKEVETQKILTYMELKSILDEAVTEKVGPYYIHR